MLRTLTDSIAATMALFMSLVGGFNAAVLADEAPKTFRRYDQAGQFIGTTRADDEGNLRFYDRDGQYRGYARQQDDGSWRTYDDEGAFDGTLREDPAGSQ